MYDILSLLLDPVIPTPTTITTGSNHDIYVAIIITVGTVIVAAITLVVASVQRERSPRSTVEADEAERRRLLEQARRQDKQVAKLIEDISADRDELETELASVRSLYIRLRDAVFRRHLDPDELIRESV